MSLTIYRASAGSGKTYTLALKYLSFLLSSDSPSAYASILAVTFTNKATGEMKDRILSQLYNIARGGSYDPDFFEAVCQNVHADAATVSRRADAALRAIMHDYDHFRVETIDSFFQSMMTNLAHELGLTRGFKVELDDQTTIARAIDRLLTTVTDPRRKRTDPHLFQYFRWFMQQKLDEDKGWDFVRDLKSFAKKNLFLSVYQRHDEELERLTQDTELIEKLRGEMRKCKEEFENEMERRILHLNEHIKSIVDENVRTKLVSTYLKDLLKEIYMPELKTTLAAAMTDYHALIKKEGKKIPETEAIAKDLITEFITLCEYRDKNIPLYYSCKLTLANLNSLCLLGAIGREVTAITSENNTFLLKKVPNMFSRIVGKNDSSFVFERAGTTFHHVMIDEFQDTSDMQWEIFNKLLIESISEGEECMVVGDIKQSIYRWRDGDWKILYRLPRLFRNASLRTLDHNYRSAEIIVKFNNAFFVKAAAYEDGIAWHVPADWQTTPPPLIDEQLVEASQKAGTNNVGLLDLYCDVEQQLKPGAKGGYVRIQPLDKDATKEEIIEDMYSHILTLHTTQGIPYGEMCILVRRNTEAEDIIDYLANNHPELPITSDEAFHYTASPLVMALVYALKYIDDGEDGVALEMLRYQIEYLSQNETDEARTKAEQRFSAFLSQLTDASLDKRNELRHVPLYELIRRLIVSLGLNLFKQSMEGQYAYLYSFLDDVTEYLSNYCSDLHDFLVYWDEKLVNHSIANNGAEAVSILTIHKAKGLQRHTVLVPFADFSCKINARDNYLWCEEKGTHIDDEQMNTLFGTLPLVPIPLQSSKVIEHSIYATDYANEKHAVNVDSMNMLYVALTRAEKNLLIWTRSKDDSVNKWFDAFLYDRQPGEEKSSTNKKKDKKETVPVETATFEYGSPEPFVRKKQAEEKKTNPFEPHVDLTKEVVLDGAGMVGVEFRQSNAAKDFVADLADPDEAARREKQREYINRGLLYHKIFSYIRTSDDVPRAVEKVCSEGCIPSLAEARRIRKDIARYLSRPEVAKWFDNSYRIISENDILLPRTLQTDRHRTERPDRVMMNGDETIVLDYKFGKQQSAHFAQVKEYAYLLQQMGRSNVKGYLWYVFENRIVPVTG